MLVLLKSPGASSPSNYSLCQAGTYSSATGQQKAPIGIAVNLNVFAINKVLQERRAPVPALYALQDRIQHSMVR